MWVPAQNQDYFFPLWKIKQMYNPVDTNTNKKIKQVKITLMFMSDFFFLFFRTSPLTS